MDTQADTPDPLPDDIHGDVTEGDFAARHFHSVYPGVR
jgi:hypothetical protein